MQRNISIDHYMGEAMYRIPSCNLILRDPRKTAFKFGAFGMCVINWMFMDSKAHKAMLHLTIRSTDEFQALLATHPQDIVYFMSTCEHKSITLYINDELQITGGLFDKIFENSKHLKTVFESKWSEVLSELKVLGAGLNLNLNLNH
jgi:hypothetical protein